MGTTADKLAKFIFSQERNGVIDLSAYRATKASLEEAHLDENRLGELLAKGRDPAHAVFIYAQNFASVMAEEMSVLKELRQYARTVEKAEDEYIPSFPPIVRSRPAILPCGPSLMFCSAKATKLSVHAYNASPEKHLSKAGSWTRSM